MMIVGLICGALGVCALVLPRLADAGDSPSRLGTFLLVASALLFAIGTILVRHRPPSEVLTTGIAWMMLFGGAFLGFSGLVTGELARFSPAMVTAPVLNAFLFLFLVHSLAAFSAMNWLLRYLPASVVSTKFYVSPAIAVVAGWLVLKEPISVATLGTLALILAGVGVVLWGEQKKKADPALRPTDADELED
jgi:drug/metabolite transporter (DMT)-like permease